MTTGCYTGARRCCGWPTSCQRNQARAKGLQLSVRFGRQLLPLELTLLASQTAHCARPADSRSARQAQASNWSGARTIQECRACCMQLQHIRPLPLTDFARLQLADVSGFTKLNETFAALGEHGAEKVSAALNE